MDSAPLVSAHTHARKAIVNTHKGSAQTARDEHELAAGEFGTAAKDTDDLEAIRVLLLLQEHHNQLATLLHAQSITQVPSIAVAAKDASSNQDATPTVSDTATILPQQPASPRTSSSPARTRRNPHRDLASSIASNLARQRRGLPATSELSTQQATGNILSHIDRPGYNTRQLSPERSRRSTKASTTIETGIPPPIAATRRAHDESFSKFYNTFETLFSKLSAPLAFAGLPLTAEQALAESANVQARAERMRAPASDDPDLSRIYSNAALKAIREDAGPALGPQESFYLVPPTGGTVSYAGIVSGGRDLHGRSAAQVPETIDEDADEFVDAQETPGSQSPRSLRNSRKGILQATSRDGGRRAFVKSNTGKTMEELELENNALKQLLDTQAQRLQMWEMSSQSQSMALQQSIRAARPPPSLPATVSDPISMKSAVSTMESDYVKELEEVVRAERAEKEELAKKNEKIARENEKLHGMIERYRDKWNQLKAGARKRTAGSAATSKAPTEVEGDDGEAS